MSEKKFTKISLSTFFLILAIIVIVVMAFFLYKNYNEKNIEDEKVSNLNKEVKLLQDTNNDLQEKINSIANTLKTNNTSTNTTKSETKEEKTKQVENSKKDVKYTYTSADKAAFNGNPKILKVYEISENELEFEYNSGYDFEKGTIDKIVKGTAKVSTKSDALYEYEESVSGHNYKMTFEFNDDENSVKVSEYDNSNELSFINLWK